MALPLPGVPSSRVPTDLTLVRVHWPTWTGRPPAKAEAWAAELSGAVPGSGGRIAPLLAAAGWALDAALTLAAALPAAVGWQAVSAKTAPAAASRVEIKRMVMEVPSDRGELSAWRAKAETAPLWS